MIRSNLATPYGSFIKHMQTKHYEFYHNSKLSKISSYLLDLVCQLVNLYINNI
jgi:hypothetical protein